jgi:hypothetical protein
MTSNGHAQPTQAPQAVVTATASCKISILVQIHGFQPCYIAVTGLSTTELQYELHQQLEDASDHLNDALSNSRNLFTDTFFRAILQHGQALRAAAEDHGRKL